MLLKSLKRCFENTLLHQSLDLFLHSEVCICHAVLDELTLGHCPKTLIGLKWLESEAYKIRTWLFLKALSLTMWVWWTCRLSRKTWVFCLFMRVRKDLRKSTKSVVLIERSLWSNATTLPWTSIAPTTATHLKPIFALLIFNEVSPAFAQYLALIWLLVKHASSTKTMFARCSISLMT